ncbi:MAG: hypothetical protein INR71_12475, partial [Terriglobus roseus]|nr:hypothetical protein [Terriglobus roseus]
DHGARREMPCLDEFFDLVEGGLLCGGVFGLVLVEIALWMPLLDFLDANAADFDEDADEAGNGGSGNKPARHHHHHRRRADLFTPDDARELQKRVLRMARKELAFCVGTQYRDAVKWCLQYADQDAQQDPEQQAWRPALDFYNRVVVPLSRLAAMGDVPI